MNGNEKKMWKTISSSKESKRTLNKIREIVDQLDLKTINQEKSLINLSLGDPSHYGNLDPHEFVTNSVKEALEKGKFNGYGHSCGLMSARNAVAKKYSTKNQTLQGKDVIITSSCSSALEISFAVLGNEGDNFLLPKPGFGIYDTICGNKGFETRYYNLLPENDWEIDLKQLESLIDDKTKGILINNPSNPCGSVYSREHLTNITKIAEKYCIPIISDEVYANMTYFGKEFVPIASVTDTVPILTCGGLAKQYLVPGWRIGWILIFDKNDYFLEIRDGIQRLTTLILGANTLIQGAMENIFKKEPNDYMDQVNKQLESHAKFAYERISKIKGLKANKPKGAMYSMVQIEVDLFKDEIQDDLSFSKALLKEESVLILPGKCFNYPNFFRVVLVAPEDKLKDAFDRIESFCKRYLK